MCNNFFNAAYIIVKLSDPRSSTLTYFLCEEEEKNGFSKDFSNVIYPTQCTLNIYLFDKASEVLQ